MGLRKRYLVAVVGVQGSPADAQRSEVGAYRTESAARQAGSDEWRRILFVHAPHIDRYRVVIEHDGAVIGDVPMPEVPADAAPGILDETVTPLGVPLGAAGERIEEPEADETESVSRVEVHEPSVPSEAIEAIEVAGAVEVAEAVETVETAEAVEAVEAADEPEVLETTGELKVIPRDDELLLPVDTAVTGEQPAIVRDDDPEADPGPVTPAAPAYKIEDPPEGPVPDEIIARFAEMVRSDEERAAERAERERGRGE